MKHSNKRMILAAAALMLLLCSCTFEMSDYDEPETEAETKPLLTPEELYAGTDLTPEDFEGLDIEAFIEMFKLTSDSLYGRNVRNCYEMYTAKPVVSDTDKYEYLTMSPLKKLEDGMEEQLKTVYILADRHIGEWLVKDMMIFDFERKMVYGTYTPQTRELREEDAEKVRDMIKGSGIGRMQVKKKGISLFDEGYEIMIESKDGRIAHYKGTKYYPSNIEQFVDEMYELVKNVDETQQ